MDTTKSNAVSISNTKLAASLAALGFAWRCQPYHQAETGRTVTEFFFGKQSARPEFATLPISIARAWSAGALEKAEPMHALCVMMRAQHNYDRLMDMQRGQPMALKQAKGGCMTVYRPGPELEVIKLRPRLDTTDLALAAALAGVGIPTVAIDGIEGAHRYWLPITGYLLKDSLGNMIEHDARLLMQRDPVPSDPHRLAIEVVNPMHPVTLAYDALSARAQMKRMLNGTTPMLVTEESGLVITVHPDFTGRVADHLSRRTGAPFLS